MNWGLLLIGGAILIVAIVLFYLWRLREKVRAYRGS